MGSIQMIYAGIRIHGAVPDLAEEKIVSVDFSGPELGASCDGDVKSRAQGSCTFGGASRVRCEIDCQEPDNAPVGPQ